MATPQTESWSPKIESLCWSRSCRDKASIEWVILLIKLSKMSGQSSCAVIALISQRSQTQPQLAAYSVGVEPSTYHKSPLSSGYNLIVYNHTHWTLHQILDKTILYNKYIQYIIKAKHRLNSGFSLEALQWFGCLNSTATFLPLFLCASPNIWNQV